MRFLYRLLEDKKHKEIVHLYLYKIFYLFYISCSFTLVPSLYGEKYFSKLNQ